MPLLGGGLHIPNHGTCINLLRLVIDYLLRQKEFWTDAESFTRSRHGLSVMLFSHERE